MEKLETPTHSWQEGKMVQLIWKSLTVPEKAKQRAAICRPIPLLGTYLREMNTDVHTERFRAAWLITAQTRNNSNVHPPGSQETKCSIFIQWNITWQLKMNYKTHDTT
jgi:hypothetical protein